MTFYSYTLHPNQHGGLGPMQGQCRSSGLSVYGLHTNRLPFCMQRIISKGLLLRMFRMQRSVGYTWQFPYVRHLDSSDMSGLHRILGRDRAAVWSSTASPTRPGLSGWTRKRPIYIGRYQRFPMVRFISFLCVCYLIL